MGLLWMLIVILTLLLVPSTVLLGASQTAAWIAFPLIGCGIITLGAVAATILQAMRVLQATPASL